MEGSWGEKGTVLLTLAALLLRWTESKRTVWCKETGEQMTKNITRSDLIEISEAMKNDEFQGRFTVCISEGSAVIGWVVTNGEN